MADIQFNCPQCQQKIHCDSSSAGSQVNCPACNLAVVVPNVAPAPAVQIKISTLRTIAFSAAGILAIAAVVMLVIHFSAGPRTVTFKAFVDGVDTVNLSGKNLWIEHLHDQLPNRILIDGKKWNPVWDKDTSASYPLKPAFWPRNVENIQLTKVSGRGTVSIVEKPGSSNNQTLIIKLDDGGIGGADWYEFTVSW